MKAVIVYDSVYGNTETVAKMISKSLESMGHVAELVRAKDAAKATPEGDVIIFGSPTRMGTMTGKMKRFLKKMDAGPWESKAAATFDTEVQDVIDKDGASAAAKMHDMVRAKGLKVHTPVLKVGVTGIRGPLSAGWESDVEAYVAEFLRWAGTVARDAGPPVTLAGAGQRDNASHRKGS